MSFLRWIREGVDGSPSPTREAATGLRYDFRGWYLLNKEELANVVLRQHYPSLIRAFGWNATPQGHAYWCRRYSGEVDLGEEDHRMLSAFFSYCLVNEIPDGTTIQ